MNKREEIPVSSIILNPDNYRHRPAGSQEDALAFLFGDEGQREQMMALAVDIAARGLDPSNLPIVEPADDHWRVLEGNRRIAALKVLADPHRLDGLKDMTPRQLDAYTDRFRKLAEAASLPARILCFVTDDRALADHLVHLRHASEGSHKGAGTVRWDTEGRARFEMSHTAAGTGSRRVTNTQTAAALAVLDALATHFVGDDEMEGLIERARNGGLSVLGRLVRRPEDQLRLGIQIDGDQATFTIERDALRAAMVRVLSELKTPTLNTRSTNTNADIDRYLDGISDELPKATDRLPAPVAPAAPSSTAAPAPRRRRAVADPPMRKPFAGMKLMHASAKTRAVIQEAQSLKVEEYPYLLSFTMRAIIDLYTADVMRALNKPVDESPSKRTRACHRFIDPPTGKKPVRRKFPRVGDHLASGGDLSIDTMNGFMHRPHHNPTADTIRKQSAEYQPWLEALDAYVENELTKQQSST